MSRRLSIFPTSSETRDVCLWSAVSSMLVSDNVHPTDMDVLLVMFLGLWAGLVAGSEKSAQGTPSR